MEQEKAELASHEVREHLFQDEVQFQSTRIYVYFGLTLFTILLIITFLVLNAGLAFALTCGVSIGISFSMLVLSMMRIGTKSFWVYFAWFLGVLLGFSYFGMPSILIESLESIGISYELMVVGSLLQVALFFVYVAYRQCKDFKRSVLELDSNDVKLEKGFSQKKEVVKKPRKIRKGILKKRFSVRSKFISGIREESSEPKIFVYYRYLATNVCLIVTCLLSLNALLLHGLGMFLVFAFFSMFSLAFSFLLIQMIKPGSKKFWLVTGSFVVVIVPIFIILSSF